MRFLYLFFEIIWNYLEDLENQFLAIIAWEFVPPLHGPVPFAWHIVNVMPGFAKARGTALPRTQSNALAGNPGLHRFTLSAGEKGEVRT